VDLTRISRGAQIWAVAGIVYFIASFLKWYGIDDEFQGFNFDVSFNAWDLGFLWGILWALLFIAGAILLVLPAFGVNVPRLPAIAFLLVAALATLFTLLKLIIGEDEPIETSFGIFLALVAAAVATFGGYLMFKESGGDLADLRNPDRLRSSFGATGNRTSVPPPPPPSGGTPPPPPPPSV